MATSAPWRAQADSIAYAGLWTRARQIREFKDEEAAARPLIEAERAEAMDRFEAQKYMCWLLTELSRAARAFIMDMQCEGWSRDRWMRTHILAKPQWTTLPTRLKHSVLACHRAAEDIFMRQGMLMWVMPSDRSGSIALLHPLPGGDDASTGHLLPHPLAAAVLWAMRRRYALCADLLSLAAEWLPHQRNQGFAELAAHLDHGAPCYPQTVHRDCLHFADCPQEGAVDTYAQLRNSIQTVCTVEPITSGYFRLDLRVSGDTRQTLCGFGVLPAEGTPLDRQRWIGDHEGAIHHALLLPHASSTRVSILLDLDFRMVIFFQCDKVVHVHSGLAGDSYLFAVSVRGNETATFMIQDPLGIRF